VLQLSNTSPFEASIFGLADQEGVDTLFVVVKATFRLTTGGVAIDEGEPRPVVLADEYWGEPGESSLKHASEVHLLKQGTDVVVEEPRNPVGCGFLGKRSGKQLLGHPVPNVEDLQRPIGLLGERSVPVGFGAIAPWWEPRRSRAGTYDEAWRKHQAPYLPRDFDARFFNVAPEELVVPRGLVGGEPVAVLGFHPQGMLRFDLPRCDLAITARVAGQRIALAAKIETVVLEPTDEQFMVSWRAGLPVDKKLLRVESVEVVLKKIEGVVGERRSA
jgi:hypothetical protein